MAAIEAAHLGKKVILLEPSAHIGGMPASGLGTSDVGNIKAIGGLAKTFFKTVAAIYGKVDSQNGTYYEPHIALQAFEQMLCAQPNVQLVTNAAISSISMTGTIIQSMVASNGVTYSAKEFIDSSYEGDLMAAAGVSFTVGRESIAQYNEPLNGVIKTTPMNGAKVDPYVIPGNSSSGLLPHIESITLPPPGSADNSVQGYNYRLCLSKDPNNQIAFTAPDNYDPAEFEALARMSEALVKAKHTPAFNTLLSIAPLPNGKYDANNGADFSTDEIGEGLLYPNGTPAQRQAIAAEHKRYMQALLYFLQTSTRLPAAVNAGAAEFGYCKDEFTDTAGFPHQLYVREGRRMLGTFVMTQQVIYNKSGPDSIGLGSYNFDSHINNRVAVKGDAEIEGLTNTPNSGTKFEVGNPYPIAYGSLTPSSSEATNLLVSVCVSASHVAFSSLRMEPTYMIMGQSAGAAASLAIDEAATTQNISYPALSAQLLKDGQILSWSSGS